MRIPLLILGNPYDKSCPVRLSAGRYKFHFENVVAGETNLPAEIRIEEATVFQVEFTKDCTGKNINIFAERIDD